MKLTNKYNLPAPVVRAVQRDPYDRGPATFSISNLIDAPRAQTLQWKYDDEIEEDIADRVFSLLGRAVHQILEDGADTNVETPEERLFMDVTINGTTITVSGAMDLQEAPKKRVDIKDWKVTSVYGFQADKEAWHNQLNCYAHLVRYAQKAGVYSPDGSWRLVDRVGRDVGSLGIVAILRDWSSGKAKTTQGYPPAAIQEVAIPLWTPDDAEAYFNKRVSMHLKARAADFAGRELPLCSQTERWEDNPTYAVKKPANKRATKVFEEKQNAIDFINESSDTLIIEERGGTPRRCDGNWCKVAEFCSQNKRRLEEAENDDAS